MSRPLLNFTQKGRPFPHDLCASKSAAGQTKLGQKKILTVGLPQGSKRSKGEPPVGRTSDSFFITLEE
ncbi:hypothetical protein BSQ39_02740 [Loigolactobacillus backii]|nr:hypothetical protein AYR52_09275 [Loigolactobacillus backii]ANK65306.1 hypothetical protein AYR54_08680 [Loigolactobacillus backii]ANK67867.1 hypothetical protein AYR55_09290 [Loigolactobacillus backii]OLF69487.1 hypothetical protein ACX53_07760 [Loigolactobacillus backii]PIO82557.1 hypothetical protein BSQ39_02740 [Loigolactobacillus backii]